MTDPESDVSFDSVREAAFIEGEDPDVFSQFHSDPQFCSHLQQNDQQDLSSPLELFQLFFTTSVIDNNKKHKHLCCKEGWVG